MRADEVVRQSNVPGDYALDIDEADSLDELREVLEEWSSWIASDALQAIPVDDSEFARFKDGLAVVRLRGVPDDEWADRYMHLVIPERMLRVSVLASRWNVPWGTAYIRLRDKGVLDRVFVGS